MNSVTVEQHDAGVRVRSGDWTIEHSARHGGAWSSVFLNNGSGRNLLVRPITSLIRFHVLKPDDMYGGYTVYSEALDGKAQLRVAESSAGFPVVIAEGVYRNEKGEALPVGFRRSTEYREFGLIWSTLEIMSETGCEDVVHVRAFEAVLRPGLTDLYAREHPILLSSSDQCSPGRFYALPKDQTATVFSSRYTPLHMLAFERGVEGIEFFPSSDLAEWDCNIKPEPGLGLYQAHHGAEGTTLEWDPYCLAFRRQKIRLQGTLRYRLGIGLPTLKPARQVHTGPFHAALNSDWASDAEIARLAKAGVKLLRFHNDFREGGPFWHDGVYPPYDEAGMAELRRVIETAHRHGMKIVPYISLKELHPECSEYGPHHRAWMHMAAHSLDVIHTHMGSGEYGGLMCLKSGWLDSRKRSIETILGDLPWDGLYFDWCVAHPCCHPDHARGPWHSDMDEFLDFLLFCRRRVGEEGTLFMHLSGLPSLVAENMADLAFIYEDIGHGLVPLPGEFPAQCEFIPTVPRQLVVDAKAGSEIAARFVIGGMLEGCPPCTAAPTRGFSLQVRREMDLFRGLDLPAMAIYRAGEGALKTGADGVYAAAFVDAACAVLYAGNLSDQKAAGRLRFPGIKNCFDPKARFNVELREPGGARKKAAKTTTIKGSELAREGLKYQLPSFSSCVFVLRPV
ncbi:MAG: hypothetical protein ACREJ2_02720 [Planctomycetota bacterium]